MHFEVSLKGGEKSQEDCQREFKHCRHWWNTIFGESNTQILLDGCHKHFMGAEHRTSILKAGQQQLERQNLGTQLMGSIMQKPFSTLLTIYHSRPRPKEKKNCPKICVWSTVHCITYSTSLIKYKKLRVELILDQLFNSNYISQGWLLDRLWLTSQPYMKESHIFKLRLLSSYMYMYMYTAYVDDCIVWVCLHSI